MAIEKSMAGGEVFTLKRRPLSYRSGGVWIATAIEKGRIAPSSKDNADSDPQKTMGT